MDALTQEPPAKVSLDPGLAKTIKKGARALRGKSAASGETEDDAPRSFADEVYAEVNDLYRRADAALSAEAEVIKPAATNAQLLAFIQRVEAVELEMAERSEDRKQIYAEARSCGFDVPTMKKVVALRKMDAEDRRAADALLDTYMRGVGMDEQLRMEM